MSKTFQLRILTPERQVLETEVESVTLPGVEGELGVWAGHAPLLAALGPGLLRVGRDRVFALSGGFAEVKPDAVVVLAETLEEPAAIDVERARRALARAEQRLAAGGPEVDRERARAAQGRARARLKAAAKA